MCRYAWHPHYRPHFACFSCRKAFKQPAIEDWLAVRDRGHVYNVLSKCAQNSRGLEQKEQELGARRSDLEAEYQEASHRCPECREPMADLGLDF